ncbi:unnamed protein product [Merluccius merluccius]
MPRFWKSPHAVRMARTVVLEAGQEYLVGGTTHFREPVKGEVLLSPTKVLVTRVVIEAPHHSTVPLHLFNPGNTAITIKKGAIAGFLQPAKALQPTKSTAQPEKTVSSSPAVPKHLQELYAQSSIELDAEEQLQLAQLLCTYDSVFSTGPDDLGRINMVQHDIITQPGVPVKQPPRQMAWEKQ